MNESSKTSIRESRGARRTSGLGCRKFFWNNTDRRRKSCAFSLWLSGFSLWFLFAMFATVVLRGPSGFSLCVEPDSS